MSSGRRVKRCTTVFRRAELPCLASCWVGESCGGRRIRAGGRRTRYSTFPTWTECVPAPALATCGNCGPAQDASTRACLPPPSWQDSLCEVAHPGLALTPIPSLLRPVNKAEHCVPGSSSGEYRRFVSLWLPVLSQTGWLVRGTYKMREIMMK